MKSQPAFFIGYRLLTKERFTGKQTLIDLPLSKVKGLIIGGTISGVFNGAYQEFIIQDFQMEFLKWLG